MPSINIYTKKDKVQSLKKLLPQFREYVAKALSCGSITLVPNEISLRILLSEASLQIADTELEIKVYHFPERVNKQDNICLAIKKYIETNCPEAGSVYVWLQLSELGHSAK